MCDVLLWVYVGFALGPTLYASLSQGYCPSPSLHYLGVFLPSLFSPPSSFQADKKITSIERRK